LNLELDDKIELIEFSDIHLQQILINLILNAIDALDRTEHAWKQIRIKTRKEKGDIILSISDNGPGVPEENREKIFNPFFTTHENSENMGLGLFIVSMILKTYNSKIILSENEFGGATFTMRISKK
jgi:C4-dicarboxylate-specific signal transduction histidine kinase